MKQAKGMQTLSTYGKLGQFQGQVHREAHNKMNGVPIYVHKETNR